jgi:hypothetical protein
MSKVKLLGVCGFLILALPTLGLAQKKTKVLPILNSISPSTATAGGGSFILTATGSSFTTGSVVRWNGNSRTTTYISPTQLVASISALDIATAGTAQVSVFTSGGSGGQSGYVTFTITEPATAPLPPPPPPPSATPLSITTTSLPGSTAGTSYKSNVAASGGTPAYVWGLVSGGGALPPGLALQADGTIAGSPTQAGTFTFTTQASDQASQIAQKVLSITVAAPPTTSSGGNVLFKQDFETGSLSGFNFVWTTDQVTLNSDPTYVRTGKYSARFYYTICGDSTNTACGGKSQDSNRYLSKYFNDTTGFPNGLEDFYARGYVYVKSPEPGGTLDNVGRKLIYWMDNRSSWTWWGVVATHSKNGTLPLTIQTNSSIDGVPNVPYWDVAVLSFDRWHCIELRVKANTPGLSDGLIALWVDGQKVFEKSGLNLRGSATTGTQVVRFGEQTNRYNYDPVYEYRYWDDIIVSTGYIGP